MADSTTHKLELKKVNQIGIVVRDSDKVMESWSTLFGIGPWTVRDFETKDLEGHPAKVKLCFADLGGVQLELIEPVEGRAFHSLFLEEHGEGLHHLGFQVNNVDAEAENLVKQGAKVLSSLSGGYAYMDTGGPGGVIFEVIRRRERPR